MDFTVLQENANVWFFSTDNFETNYDWKHQFHKKDHTDLFKESYYITTVFFYFHIQFQYCMASQEYLFSMYAMQSDMPKTKEDWQLELPPISLPDASLTKHFNEKYHTVLRQQNMQSRSERSYHYKKVKSMQDLVSLLSFWKEIIAKDFASVFEEERIFMEQVRRSTN